ncbi:MAG: PEP-CTERM sorting domain-containing protein [Phycisphaerae bacterium]|nr:PEP-CTERM sorting domain-containing protein [Phycisphaerae bacterium]
MKKTLGMLAVATAVVGFSAMASMASVLVDDNFNAYTQGDLVPQGGWLAHSGAGVGPVQVVDSPPCFCPEGGEAGNAIELFNDGSSEDVSIPAGAIMEAGDKWYAGFCLYVEAVGPMADAGDYFAHFKTSGTYFTAKVGIQAAEDGVSDYSLYLWQGAGDGDLPGEGIPWANDFMYETCHRVITSYDFDTGDVEMWIDPDCALGAGGNPSVTITGVYPNNAIEAYAFRQYNYNDPDPVHTIDNLLVATTWDEVCCQCVPEPATLSLLGFGALALIRRRR